MSVIVCYLRFVIPQLNRVLFVTLILPAGGDERLADAVVGKDLIGVLFGDGGQGDNVFLDHVIHRQTISL